MSMNKNLQHIILFHFLSYKLKEIARYNGFYKIFSPVNYKSLEQADIDD